MATAPYYAPTYFPPSYFFAPATTPPGPGPATPASPSPSGRDGAAYAALLSMLKATGAFDEVLYGDPARCGRASAGRHPLAVVIPRGWEEADDSDPSMLVRRTTFTLRIVVLDADDRPALNQLDRLSATIETVVDGSDLGGICLPALTRIRAGRFEASARYPEQSVDLDGEFLSLFDPSTLASNLPSSR